MHGFAFATPPLFVYRSFMLRAWQKNNHHICLPFCPPSALRQGLHNPAMRTLPCREGEQKIRRNL
jgi:hypothetical protein